MVFGSARYLVMAAPFLALAAAGTHHPPWAVPSAILLASLLPMAGLVTARTDTQAELEFAQEVAAAIPDGATLIVSTLPEGDEQLKPEAPLIAALSMAGREARWMSAAKAAETGFDLVVSQQTQSSPVYLYEGFYRDEAALERLYEGFYRDEAAPERLGEGLYRDEAALERLGGIAGGGTGGGSRGHSLFEAVLERTVVAAPDVAWYRIRTEGEAVVLHLSRVGSPP